MATFTSRITILLSPEEQKRLEEIARQRHTSIGSLIRKALHQTYIKEPLKAREKAAEYLCSLELPVDEWEKMEKEIIEGTSFTPSCDQ
ncbi:MAG: CopG family transcriptional regulator [Actinomycetota bacterium]|nr:CopG family transcriptional regulator [Actinomycetota bacterium]MDI6822685.1 CopG family transcriptional regulator [Actinomycetota bacterium]